MSGRYSYNYLIIMDYSLLSLLLPEVFVLLFFDILLGLYFLPGSIFLTNY